MENAAKALSIAGGILIAVMLAVLVYYVFTHWGESQRIKQEDVEVQKVEDFNKSYLSYEKVLYGSELLGLVNKMSDYNISDDVKYSGYSKMNLSMKITDKTTGNLFSNGTYSLSSISNPSSSYCLLYCDEICFSYSVIFFFIVELLLLKNSEVWLTFIFLTLKSNSGNSILFFFKLFL